MLPHTLIVSALRQTRQTHLRGKPDNEGRSNRTDEWHIQWIRYESWGERALQVGAAWRGFQEELKGGQNLDEVIQGIVRRDRK